jgi:hypothetical protein
MTFVATNRPAVAARLVLKMPIPAPGRDAVHRTNLRTPAGRGSPPSKTGGHHLMAC